MVRTKKPFRATKASKRKRVDPKNLTTELLFEIGTEELPYQFVDPVLQQLKYSIEELLQEYRLAHGTITTMGTPRRLVVVVSSLAKRQTPFLQETFGPPKTAAYTPEGQPTKAAVGFATSQKISVQDLEIRQTPKGEYVCAVKQDKGKGAHAVMEEILTTLVGSIGFPKAMRWNKTGMRFARPIRWLLALCEGRIIPLTMGGVKAGGQTRGHRFLSGGGVPPGQGISVKNFEHYLNILGRHMVIPDQSKRKQLIEDQLQTLAKTVQGQVELDPDLIAQAVYMVEWPQAILGSFDKGYLSLPAEILTTSMKEHQGYFPLTKKDGSLLPQFISITNMKLKDMRLIREGNERVLSARLADAKFFFDEDQKTTLDARVGKLNHMTFHQKLGNLHQKVERVRELAKEIPGKQGTAPMKAPLTRAAYLCKADLLTGMVGEFPTLQGIMGGAYARIEGEDEETCLAIRDHYLPKAMDDAIPTTMLGRLLSLADRIDTLAAFFYVNMIPSGSEDPLGLRRHASAIVRIIIEGDIRIDLFPLIDQAWRNIEKEGFQSHSTQEHILAVPPWKQLVEFLSDRLRHYGRIVHGFRDDVISAVLDSTGDQPYDLVDKLARMSALQNMTTFGEFDPLMIGFKRAHRLTGKEEWTRSRIDPSLFQDASEQALYRQLQETKGQMPQHLAQGEYPQALSKLVTLKPVIDDFFTGVMVNDDRPDVRANRLTLLEEVASLFMSFADFSQIQVQKT